MSVAMSMISDQLSGPETDGSVLRNIRMISAEAKKKIESVISGDDYDLGEWKVYDQ